MLARVLLIAAILAGLYVLIRWLRRSFPSVQTSHIALVVGVTALLLLLTVRGAAEITVPLLIALVPLLVRWLGPYLRSTPSSTANSGRSGRSVIVTRFLQMALDHVTGEMSGTVQEGSFAGYVLVDLDVPQLLELWHECQADPQSVAVLEAYLDRHHVGWRDYLRGAASGEQPSSSDQPRPMSRSEAYEILGLQPGASREEIQTAYRRLIQRLHPDRGGSAYLAARLNQARGVLLGGFS
ncbi:MAG: DnaJ domain-containing protein [Candidatus Competibacteraceae bacterium]